MLRLVESPLVAGSINQRSRYNRNPDPLFSSSLLVSLTSLTVGRTVARNWVSPPPPLPTQTRPPAPLPEPTTGRGRRRCLGSPKTFAFLFPGPISPPLPFLPPSLPCRRRRRLFLPWRASGRRRRRRLPVPLLRRWSCHMQLPRATGRRVFRRRRWCKIKTPSEFQ